MSELNEHVLEGFRDELRKLAMNPRLFSALGSAGAVGGVGAATGALLGAGVQGVKNYRDARREGATIGQALSSGVMGGVQGGMSGGAMGGLLGAGAGAALGGISARAGNQMRTALDGFTGAHFGQRQVHALTGWTPEKGIGSIGLGAETRKGLVSNAMRELAEAKAGKGVRTLGDVLMRRNAVQGAEKRLSSAREALAAAERAEKMGLTSIPGYAKSLVKNPVETLQAAVGDQWHGMSPAMKAMTVGMPALELAGTIRSKTPEGEDPGEFKGKAIGRSIAGTAAGMLLSPMPQMTQMLLQGGLSSAGESLGGRIGRLRGKVQPPPPPGPQPQDLTADSGQAVPGERYVSERAGGAGEGVPA